MKKILLMLLSSVLFVGCSTSTDPLFKTTDYDNEIVEKNYDDIIQKINNDDTFLLYIGRSDCQDCNDFYPYMKKHVKMPKNSAIYSLDIKNMRDKASEKTALQKDVDVYNNMKKYFNLKWVPTVKMIKFGQIIDTYEYNNVENNIDAENATVYEINSRQEFDKFVNKYYDILKNTKK